MKRLAMAFLLFLRGMFVIHRRLLKFFLQRCFIPFLKTFFLYIDWDSFSGKFRFGCLHVILWSVFGISNSKVLPLLRNFFSWQSCRLLIPTSILVKMLICTVSTSSRYILSHWSHKCYQSFIHWINFGRLDNLLIYDYLFKLTMEVFLNLLFI